MVDLILLHGPPAAGKLTTALELAPLIDARVLHNHLTLDVAKALHDFGTPAFWALVDDLRSLVYRSCFVDGSRPVIATWCYEHPADEDRYRSLRSIASDAGGRILPVFLSCAASDLHDRVDSEERRRREKLCDGDTLWRVLREKRYGAIPDERCIEVDSGSRSAVENARRIVDRFGLA